jgi:hypothetical protein
MTGAENLTGVWHGFYAYPIIRARVPFDATLIESGSWLSGSIHEISTLGPTNGQMIYSTLLGERSGSRVTFTKTYDGSAPGYRVVHYEGTLSADGTEIEGRWSIPRNWSGRFRMTRPKPNEETVEHKVFERA